MTVANADDRWRNMSAVEFELAVRAALAYGAHLVARKLAFIGAGLYPNNSQLQKMAHILAPPRTIRTDIPPESEDK